MSRVAAAVVLLMVAAALIAIYLPVLAQLANLVRRFLVRQIETAKRYYNGSEETHI